MRVFRSPLSLAVLTVLCAAWWLPMPTVTAQSPTVEPVNLDLLYRIKDEGLQRSQVMETASWLTDVHGPRLAGSPEYNDAVAWAQSQLKTWGLSNVHTEAFAFGRGWRNRRFIAQAVTPRPFPIIAAPKAWTPGTQGTVTAEAVLVALSSDDDLKKYAGTLRGKFVLSAPVRRVDAHFDALGHRLTEAELEAQERQPSAVRGTFQPPTEAQRAFQRAVAKFWVDEGVAAVLEPSRGDGGTLFVQSGGSRTASDPPVAPQVVVAAEHYNRIVRQLEKKQAVTLQFDIQNEFLDGTTDSTNVVAEIPGTDRANEVVMLGAHFDSWHAGTGATDNAAGSAVMMEAMRILKAANIPLRRTVRLALWGAEEQGLIGSAAYVAQHFADPKVMRPTAEHARLSGYFNVDNGTGQIRGIYRQGNEAVTPIFEAWMAPFRNMGMTSQTVRNTGGTDHLSFDAVGLPGFQFIQDPVEYDTRTHHSNQDLYDRLQPQDMMQNAVIVAAFVANAANRDALLPRKPLPAPRARN